MVTESSIYSSKDWLPIMHEAFYKTLYVCVCVCIVWLAIN